MIVRSLQEAVPFTTKDGSTIRSLLDSTTAPVEGQSLAEATLEPGHATQRHHHRQTEEIYLVTEGRGRMEIDGEERDVAVCDAILIPPGARHQLRNDGDGALRILCCCAPPYRHDDTYLD